MIDQRQLIKEIPSGKFHSALMTSFSINLYYWEIQLLRSLSAKGINFVSALVDSECLSDQLLKFSKAFRGRKPLDFSLHGYKMKGAFHPKIQFYVGRNSILALVGSGNLTVMGHGRNLEVWSPVMVESAESPAYPFICNVWSYLKSLYLGLGEEAESIICSIEENCELLGNEYINTGTEQYIGTDSIRFFTNQKASLFEQCKDWIGNDKIKSITIMSPFYDRRAELVKALYDQFKPEELRLIVEDDFGVLPQVSSIPSYAQFYKWQDVIKASDKKYQRFYHAKCFFFEGERYHYLLCGSANASVAAFGLPGVMPNNQEASVGFKSPTIDYFRMTGFTLTNLVSPSDVRQSFPSETTIDHAPVILWIKEASYYLDSFELCVDNTAEDVAAVITFYSGNRKQLYITQKTIRKGTDTIGGHFGSAINPLYVEITNHKGEMISNRQFVIPSEIMEVNNPSSESVNNRRRYHDIESGKFVNGEVLRFIEQILNDTETRLNAKNGTKTIVENRKSDGGDGHTFNSVADYLKDDGTGITGDRSIRKGDKGVVQSSMLFDSIIAYISKSSKEKEEEEIDEEETENVQKSGGKEKKAPLQNKPP